MGSAAEDRAKAADLPEGDVIRILLEQHARIQDLFDEVASTRGDHKQMVFDELRALLAVHETAEELVLRPVSKPLAGDGIADARNEEEAEANKVLADLEKLDVTTSDFDTKFAAFRTSVLQHAENEEKQEFPAVLSQCDPDKRRDMGSKLKSVESLAPTHPHPSTAGSTAAQLAVGPFASLVDRTRDALNRGDR
jgi:hemerythrin superfamily protein